MVIFTASSTTFQFLVMGQLQIDYALFFCCIGTSSAINLHMVHACTQSCVRVCGEEDKGLDSREKTCECGWAWPVSGVASVRNLVPCVLCRLCVARRGEARDKMEQRQETSGSAAVGQCGSFVCTERARLTEARACALLQKL